MLSFHQPAPGQNAYAVDSFERTSSREVAAAGRLLVEAYEKDRNRSRVRELFERFEIVNNWLNELCFVPNDWNAYGSPAPTRPSVERARSILTTLWAENLVPDRALPSAEGGVALIFRTPNQNRAVVEALNDFSAYVLLYDRRGNSQTLEW